MAWMMIAMYPGGTAARKRGRRKEPMNAMPKIITGKRANERLPNIVECTRHSSFIMFTKSLCMGILLHEREEESVEVLAPVLYPRPCRYGGVFPCAGSQISNRSLLRSRGYGSR